MFIGTYKFLGYMGIKIRIQEPPTYVALDRVLTLQVDEVPVHLWHKETIQEMPNTDVLRQPPIASEGEGEVEGDAMEEDAMAELLVGEEKDLMEDNLREYHKVDCVNTIASLRMKSAHLF